MKQVKFAALACAAALALSAGSASATLIASGGGDISSTDLTQLGRVNRNGTASTWASPKAFPGVLATGTTFYYDTVDISFAPNALQTIYYAISWQNLDVPTPHLAAYRDAYNPLSLSTNYLGDFGATPPGGTGTRTFQVAVGAGHSLVLAFSNTAINTDPDAFGRYEYSVSAFSDTGGGENFLFPPASVPEPTSLALVALAALGLGLSRRRKA